jgi:hypothetical protein
MKTKTILVSADKLTAQLMASSIKRDYPEQLFRYLIEQKAKEKERKAVQNLETLMEKMPKSGFEKRGKSYFERFTQTKKILSSFKVEQPLLQLPLNDLLQILGWTIRLMRFKEGDN